MGYFTANTNKLIESNFAGAVNALQAACEGLSGKAVSGKPGYDFCVDLAALPRVTIRLSFNDRDEDFPARCTFLLRKSSQAYLTLKSMAVAGTWLAGRLVNPGN
jgi:hypothetical protein